MRRWVVAALLVVGCNRGRPALPAVVHDAGAADTHALGTQTMAQNCQMCHSLDLVRAQRLSRATWEKEVKKMIGWGAPVPAENVPSLIDVLAAELGPDAPAAPPEEVEPAAVASAVEADREAAAGDAKKGTAVYQVACASCHGPDGVGGPIGPTLAHRLVLHRARDFEEVVRSGRQRMPAVPLEPAAMRDVMAFLRAQR